MSDEEPDGIPFVGGILCLDFANTSYVEDGESIDMLEEGSGLEYWLAEAHRAKVLPADVDPYVDYESFPDLISLRDALSAGAKRLAAGKQVSTQALGAVNASLRSGRGHYVLVRKGEQVTKTFRFDGERTLELAVAESAAWLFSEGNPARVKRCEADGCRLYFYDETERHTRRFCSRKTANHANRR